MRLERQREEEVARRKGSAFKTIIGTIWLGLCFAGAYFFVGFLFQEGYVRPSFFWNQLFIPRWIDADWIRILFAVFIVFLMNFFLLIGFAFSSATGRTRPGEPSLKSRNPDPLDKTYYR